MTVSTTSTRTTVLGNGSTTTFAYSFPISDPSYAALIYTDANGNATTLSTALWSITGAGAGSVGGTFTYPLSGSPVAAGTSLTLVRNTPLLQTTSLPNQGPALPTAVELTLDRIVEMIQELAYAVAHIQSATNTVVPPGTVTSGPYDQIVALGNQTDTIATGTNVITLVMIRPHVISGVTGAVASASSLGQVQFDVKLNGASILSSAKCTVPAGATSSLSNPAVITGGSVSVSPGDVLTFDILASGTGAVGPMVQLTGAA